MKCMCAQTRPRFILSSERVFGGMEFETMLTPREKSPLPENFPRGGSNPRRCGQRAQTLPTSYSGPHHDYNDDDDVAAAVKPVSPSHYQNLHNQRKTKENSKNKTKKSLCHCSQLTKQWIYSTGKLEQAHNVINERMRNTSSCTVRNAM